MGLVFKSIILIRKLQVLFDVSVDLRIDLTFLELWRLIDGLTQLFSQFPSEHFHFFLINLVLKRLELTLRQTNCQIG